MGDWKLGHPAPLPGWAACRSVKSCVWVTLPPICPMVKP